MELPAGPRPAGPENPGLPCDELSDELILESYTKAARKTLKSYYYDPAAGVIWGDNCAESLSETQEWAEEVSELEEPELSTSTTDYFYEAALCSADREQRVRYRRLRCDYFDGATFFGETPPNGDAPGFLGSLLWFLEAHGIEGYQFLSSAHVPGDTTESAEICTIRTTFGDFGLCDEITLEARRVTIEEDGWVSFDELGERKLQGQCR